MTDPKSIIDGAAILRPRSVETLALAFQDDPALAWIFPDAATRRRRLPRFFAWGFADHVRHGMILASPEREVVTLWRRPGKVHHHDPLTPAELWRMVRIFGTALGRADTVGKHLSRHVPAGEGYLYLRYAAVRLMRRARAGAAARSVPGLPRRIGSGSTPVSRPPRKATSPSTSGSVLPSSTNGRCPAARVSGR